MDPETKICQNCKVAYEIDAADFAFYEKIKVPAPTFCPKCRLQRRLAFFNLLNLYQRKCDLCGELKISCYPPEAPYKIYCPQCWWSDKWDPLSYGRDYDFSRNFFEQFNQLLQKAPLLGLSIDLPTALSSPYTNHVGHLKNCYLLFHADENEDSGYGMAVFHNKEVLDSSLIFYSSLCYDSIYVWKGYNCVGVDHTFESLDCFFLRDCSNCQNCFASANLRHKKYHIFNKPHSKEGYFEEIKKWDLGSYKIYEEVKKLAQDHWRKFPPQPIQNDRTCKNVSGNYIGTSKNCQYCFQVVGAEDCKYLFMTESPPIKDCYDISSWGNNLSLSYECLASGEFASNMKFCYESGINLHNAEYCKLSTGGSDHFGCVSVKKGDHVIFNKPYHEEEYTALRQKIINHMNKNTYKDAGGRVYKYGDFFPTELSPLAYNTTIAYQFFPLSKEEVLKSGWQWREPDIKEYACTKSWEDLPDHIKDAPLDIAKEIIKCRNCVRGFRIISMELDFLRRKNLPLPRECPFCRIDKKFRIWIQRLKILKRICPKCGQEFETSFSEEEVKELWCEDCYLKEII